MKTYLDCIPCFFRQAIEGGRIAGLGERKQKIIVDALARHTPSLFLRSSPPQAAQIVQRLLCRVTGKRDVYRQIKKRSNELALSVYGRLRDKVLNSRDSLLTAVELAIAGNIIDYGAKYSLNIGDELEKIISDEDKAVGKENKKIFAYGKFKSVLRGARKILYLADNAGEIVFDRILIEEIKKRYPEKEIIFAVKSKPAINDALEEDARMCGLDKIARVITNGADLPGTVLSLCSREFLTIYRGAEMIISKGQGNFEALSRSNRPVFFMFKVKCRVVAEETGCDIGDIVLMYYNGGKKI